MEANTPPNQWTGGKVAYANALLHDFERGLLDIPPGTQLLSFLAQMLRSDEHTIAEHFAHILKDRNTLYSPSAQSSTASDLMEKARRRREKIYEQWCVESQGSQVRADPPQSTIRRENADDWMNRSIDVMETATESIELVPLLQEGRVFMARLHTSAHRPPVTRSNRKNSTGAYLNSLCRELHIGYMNYATATLSYSSPLHNASFFEFDFKKPLIYSDGGTIFDDNVFALRLLRVYCNLLEKERYLRLLYGKSYSCVTSGHDPHFDCLCI